MDTGCGLGAHSSKPHKPTTSGRKRRKALDHHGGCVKTPGEHIMKTDRQGFKSLLCWLPTLTLKRPMTTLLLLSVRLFW